MTHKLKFFFIVSLQFFCVALAAQKTTQVEIINADTFEGDESLGKNVSKLNGNVQFSHQGALMFCDSAYLYQETNSLDAFGKIRIVKGDSITLTGDFLKYDGNSRKAAVTGDVTMTDRDMVLKSKNLNYDMTGESAEYFNGGRLNDNKNVLTSSRGYYFAKEKLVYFKDSVVLVNPDYSIIADTLKYHTGLKTAFFAGPTFIYSGGTDSSRIYCEQGWYNTISENSVFAGNPYIVSKENKLSGDSLWYDNRTAVGIARKNVVVSDSLQNIIITGGYGRSDNKLKTGLVTEKAVLIKVFENDSLFLHADTLFARQDTVTLHKSWMAYHGVRIYKTDLQGTCDSLVYTSSDSLISFHTDPVLWSEENQLTADFINMQIANSKISELRLFNSAFIISMEDSLRFNQIKGRDMTGYFSDNKLSSIKVEGNGQSVYYTRNSKKQFTGVNRADCSDMLIFINEESKIKSITLINQPDATLYPIDELSPSELRLRGFSWRHALRPLNKDDIFR